MKNTYKIALGGIITALSVLLMFLTGLFPMATYALPGIAGVLLVCAVIEIGSGYAFMIYAAVSLLSIFIAPDKEAAVMYILILGYYPVVKKYIEKLNKLVIEWILKLALFNITVIAAWCIVMYVLKIPDDSMGMLGQYGPYILLALGNVTFIIYDIAITGLIGMYMQKIHPFLKKLFKIH